MKRGQGLPINTIILAILGLVVLIILILLVRTQLQKGSSKYSNITSTAEQQAKDQSYCENMFAYPPRSCTAQSDCKGSIVSGYIGCPSGKVCCET